MNNYQYLPILFPAWPCSSFSTATSLCQCQYINATSTGAMIIFSEHNRNQCFIINEVSEVENVDIGEPCFLSWKGLYEASSLHHLVVCECIVVTKYSDGNSDSDGLMAWRNKLSRVCKYFIVVPIIDLRWGPTLC